MKIDTAKHMFRLEDDTTLVDHLSLVDLGAYIVGSNCLHSLIDLPQTFV